MSYDLSELKKRGVSSGAYKELFTAPKKSPKIQKLVDTISQRIVDGREANLADYRLYWAIDLAHETPFAQTTPTLVSNLLSKNLDAKGVLDQLESWGLSEKELFLSVDQGDGTVKKYLNPPIFFQILIPIVRAYHMAKTARIYNERDTSPLFKYRPAKNTDANRVACEIWTDICDTTTQWYGHTEYLKQFIQQILKYGICVMFPMEEWHCEKQVVDGKSRVQKEGLRYHLPHPTRMGIDLNHPAPTINTDTGCEFGWHWDVMRYGDILDNRMLWNRSAITFGTNWMDKPMYRQYFNEVFPCRLKFPTPTDPTAKREDKAAYYGTSQRDAAVFKTEFFWKLIPSNWGLGDYKYPVWHRFTVASDDTILWAAPCAYNPMIFGGYDFDAQAGTPSSFSLETIPWQDHLGNILSQMILTAKQNLDNTIFYDKNIVTEKDIKSQENLGERRYRSRNYLGYDSLKMARAGLDVKQAFFSPQFQYRSIVELQSMLSTALNLMERVLQITAQETGAAASHYQSKEEVVTVRNSGDSRLRFTSSSIDAGRDAWMQQLVEANRAYRDDEVTAQVSDNTPGLDKILFEMGFKITGDGPYKKLVVGRKSSIPYVAFARTNVDPSESNDAQAAQAIMQGVQVIASNAEFTAAVGVKRIIKMLEHVVKLTGGPDDYDLTSESPDQQVSPAILQQIAPILQQLKQTIEQGITENVAKPAAESAAKQEQEIQQLQETVKQLEGIYALAKNASDKANVKAAETAQKIQLDAQVAQAEQQRLNEAQIAEQQRLDTEHHAQLARDAEKAQLDVSIASTKAAVDVQNKQVLAAANADAARVKADAAASAKRKTAKASAKTGDSSS
jgi:hypothetical protein